MKHIKLRNNAYRAAIPNQSNIFVQSLPNRCMESRLKVKDFGPIKNIDLVLKNVNVFVGEQGTGKSALAKLYTIFKAPRKFLFGVLDDTPIHSETNPLVLFEVLDEYNIASFLSPKSEVFFESELHTISYQDGELLYTPKLKNIINNLKVLVSKYSVKEKEIAVQFKKITDKFIFFDLRAAEALAISFNPEENLKLANFQNIGEDKSWELVAIIEDIEEGLSTEASMYIPAERNIGNIIMKAALNFMKNNVPIPKYIMSFGAELEKLNTAPEINLEFIQKNAKHRNVDGKSLIYLDDDKSILLSEASSGIQSVVPLLASVSRRTLSTHRSFVIEEPELNLFPTAQYELIKKLESERTDPYYEWEDFGTMHVYTTHSPYILSSLNNLLYAHKVYTILNDKTEYHVDTYSKVLAKNEAAVKKIVKAYIKADYFTAYQLRNGRAVSIFDKKTGLIKDNYIDRATDKINEDFDALMDLTYE